MQFSKIMLLAIVPFALLCTSVDAQSTSYRTLTSVVIVPNTANGSANYYLSAVDVDGNEEAWDVDSGVSSDTGQGFQLSIDDVFQFSISTTYASFAISVVASDPATTTVDENTYLTDPAYAAFLAETQDPREFVVEIMQEMQAFGTMQGIVPTVYDPDATDDSGSDSGDSDDGFSPAPLAPADNRALCVADVNVAEGPKPKDCDGAIDEYRCCIWEMLVDACTRMRDCIDLPWYYEAPCHALAVVANGVDSAACIAGIPIPGA